MTAALCAVAAACSTSPSPRPHAAATATPTPATPTSVAVSVFAAHAAASYRQLALPPGPALTCREATHSRDPAVLVAAFLAARAHGSGAADCLSRAALATYSDARCSERDLLATPGPVVLYRCGPHVVRAFPAARLEVARSDPRYVQLEVDLSGRLSGSAPPAIVEHLRLGPGVPAGETKAARQVVTEVSPI